MAEHQRYRITERIDAGGMAEVFRGVAESLQGFKKSVAIKRVLPHLAKNQKFVSMFLDEARLSLHLQHANIVSIFDIGVAGGEASTSYFIVMEYVDGTHLKGLVESTRRQGKALTVPQVVYVMMQVCAGLAYAHDFADPETGRPLGIVHRDISPPNILLSKNGEVKLVDFGLAKATSQIESTDPGVVKGKFSYLSPEAASGKEVDRRADIFAVGILLYELFTGKRLFYGENDYQTVELVRQARVPSITQQNPGVEPELEAIIRKALARDLASRFQTAGELQDSLAQYLFSRGMKVTSRDIAELVRSCQAERARVQGVAKQSLIDTLILEELNKFTSLESDSLASFDGPGARPLSPDELGGQQNTPTPQPMDLGAFIDTTSWSRELAGDGDARSLRLTPPLGRPASSGAPAASATAASADPAGASASAPPLSSGSAPAKNGASGGGQRAYRPRPTPTQPVLDSELMEVGLLADALEGAERHGEGNGGGPAARAGDRASRGSAEGRPARAQGSRRSDAAATSPSAAAFARPPAQRTAVMTAAVLLILLLGAGAAWLFIKSHVGAP